MENSIKKTESTLSYDQEKPEVEEKNKKKPKPTFLTWQTRRKSIQAYMCVTLNLINMLQFSGALIMYGGVVWVSYFTFAVFLGVPMITAELALGHYINNEVKYVWQMCRAGKGIFWNCLISTVIAAVLCHVHLAVLLYLSFHPNEIETTARMLIDRKDQNCSFNAENKSYADVLGNKNRNYCRQEFFSDSPEDWTQTNFYLPRHRLWTPALYLATICLLMILINCKGIRSLEKVTVFFVTVPYLCTVILAMLIFTLSGAVNYIGQCWHLDWDKLKDYSVWLVSFKTVINVFCIGTLCLVFVSVHSDYNDDIMMDVVILFLNIFLNTLLYTITILGLIGVMDNKINNHETHSNFKDHIYILMRVVKGLCELPPPKWLWSFSFYCYTIGSAFTQVTLMVASVSDAVISLGPKLKTNKFYVTASICIIFYLLGLIIFATEVLKIPRFDGSFMAIGFLQSITIFWIYNYERVCSDFNFLMGYKPSLFYQITWVISPIIFLVMIITSIVHEKDIDLLVHNTVYLIVLHVFVYGLCAVIETCILLGKQEKIGLFKADKTWGPSDPLLRKSRLIFTSRIITKEHIYRQKLYEEQFVKPADITDQNIVQLW